ncbi:UNVERIFIED_CONTAM: hypothetical protein FKN15_033573 [Acipenser sinensis]
MDSGNIEKRVTRIPEYPMSSWASRRNTEDGSGTNRFVHDGVIDRALWFEKSYRQKSETFNFSKKGLEEESNPENGFGNFLPCHIKHLQKEKGWEFRVVLVEHVGNLLNASQCYNNMSEDSGEIVGLDAQLP